MLAKIPIIDSSITCREILAGLKDIYNKEANLRFSAAISEFVRAKQVFLTGSGIAAFYIILKSLSAKSKRKEVVLPAYTAGSLVIAVLKAGLIPVLCDISLEDFNFDRQGVFDLTGKNTLAVNCVHMFGIGISDLLNVRQILSDEVTLIEDCAQSFGSKVNGRQVGSFTEISFFSFNRGKNLPLYDGGCICLNSEKINNNLRSTYELLLDERDTFSTLSIIMKLFAISLATHPSIYGLGQPLISKFKETKPPKDFMIKRMSDLQAGFGLKLLEKADAISLSRNKNGSYLINCLKDIDGLILPRIAEGSAPAFNRLPLIFKSFGKRALAQVKLWEAGIESSRMYERPLHHMFNLGYSAKDFPKACYFAEGLLTLPVHPSMKESNLNMICEVIKKVCSQ